MRWQTPSFWRKKGVISLLLWPLSLIYRVIFLVTSATCSAPYKSKLPLICIGNVVIGGAGKTPTAIALGQLLKERNYHPAFISRGYGGSLSQENAIKVEPDIHTAQEVGDEPLLLAQHAPVFIARKRVNAVKLAESHKDIDVLIMDDGLQNPSLEKTISLLVMHGEYGIGNGFVFPAGPLREPLHVALNRVHAIIMNGKNTSTIGMNTPKLPCFNAQLTINKHDAPTSDKSFLAFAGIAHPDRFFSLLKKEGYHLTKTLAFADHYPYKPDDIQSLLEKAKQENAQLITTEKDWVRLPSEVKTSVAYLPVSLDFEDKEALSEWITEYLK